MNSWWEQVSGKVGLLKSTEPWLLFSDSTSGYSPTLLQLMLLEAETISTLWSIPSYKLRCKQLRPHNSSHCALGSFTSGTDRKQTLQLLILSMKLSSVATEPLLQRDAFFYSDLLWLEQACFWHIVTNQSLLSRNSLIPFSSIPISCRWKASWWSCPVALH